MKVAFVYDWINNFGGAERILLALHEIWPNAPLYTSIHNPTTAKWSNTFVIHDSFLQKIPFARNRHEFFANFTPYSFESFQFDAFDVVISITSADAKGIITKPNTLHLCYCLTPTRYIWSGYRDYLFEPGFGKLNSIAHFFMKLFSVTQRKWDYFASQRPDKYLSISNTVANRVRTYYKKDSEVLYPPVDVRIFKPAINTKGKNKYFLVVSRLVPYKKIDYVIEAFNYLGFKLKVIGNGIDEARLKNKSKKNIDFIRADLTDQELCWYYQNCSALIFPGEEDFGLTIVEAQSCGKPVIAYGSGGANESVISGRTGELYSEPNAESLIAAIKTFSHKKYRTEDCVKNAQRFSKENFKRQFQQLIIKEFRSFSQNI